MVAYEQLKSELAAKFPKGHFAGISFGKVVAEATKLEDLIAHVRGLGIDPKRVLYLARAGMRRRVVGQARGLSYNKKAHAPKDHS